MKHTSPLTRSPHNPVITPDDMPFRCYTVMNAGAVRHDNQVLLMLRVELCDRRTRFFRAFSTDGVHFTIDPQEITYPLSKTEEHTHRGSRFDMRITPFEDGYLVTHATWLGQWGCCIGMARSRDLLEFEPLPYLSVPSNRNAVLFPEKINGLYARLERPQNIDGTGLTWVSYSPDLVFWGKSLPVLLNKSPWGKIKNGPGAVPIRTDKGWLIIYHSTADTASTENYYLGAALLDLENPAKVLAAPGEFILAPEKDYECIGQTPNVVFTSGAVEMPDGTLNIYYGGADTRMCLAQTTVQALTDYCLEHHDPGMVMQF